MGRGGFPCSLSDEENQSPQLAALPRGQNPQVARQTKGNRGGRGGGKGACKSARGLRTERNCCWGMKSTSIDSLEQEVFS